MNSINTTISDIDRIFHLQSDPKNLQRIKDQSVSVRLKKILAVDKYLSDESNIKSFVAALYSDLRKPEYESLTNELVPVLMTITHIKKHLYSWVGDERVESPITMSGMRSFIRYEPKGNILIFAPWNYPFQLNVIPMLYAIAAGNAIIIKPSEFAPAMASFVRTMVQSLFSDNEVAVVEGDVAIAAALLEKPFNHIYFTGSPGVGRKVMQAAAKHLASVTLELGGKSPVILDPSYGGARAARKLAWAKTMNCGQTCIAPDYLLIHESQKDEFVQSYKNSISKFYDSEGKGVKQSPLLARIVNKQNFDRIKTMIDDAVSKGAVVLSGGEMDAEQLYIEPMLIGNVHNGMRIMQEEIFAPVLPIVTYKEREEVVKIINEHPKPLSLYILSGNRKNTEYFLSNTSAGTTAVNELMVTTVNQHLPFGGINNSGIGKSNGHYSFVEFSNARGVVKRVWGTIRLVYPPYSKTIINWLMRIARI